MVKKLRKNLLLLAVVTSLLGLSIKNVAYAINVADVVHTRYETLNVVSGITNTRYTWKTLRYPRGFTYRVTSEYRAEGVYLVGTLYTYHYNVY